MSHSRSSRTPAVLAATIAASFCAVAQAGPVETIYSAENALYGAGYEIGKADGWMDNTLRSAIRKYQSSTGELQATGNLDAKTLSALGVTPDGNGAINGNTVPDRKVAMAALGLEEKRFSADTASRTIAAAPQPEVQPEPAAKPESEPEIEPDVEIAEPEITPEPVAEPEPQPEPKPVAEKELAATPEAEAPVEVSSVEEAPEADFKLPEEPTAAGIPEVSEPAVVKEASASSRTEPAPQSSGGLFSSLFDFLFGWLI